MSLGTVRNLEKKSVITNKFVTDPGYIASAK